MKKYASVFILFLMSLSIMGQAKDHQLHVSATGSYRVAPDVIMVNILVYLDRYDPAPEDRFEELKNSALKELNIGDKVKESVNGYTNSQNYNYSKKRKAYTIQVDTYEAYEKLKSKCDKKNVKGVVIECAPYFIGLSMDKLLIAKNKSFENALKIAKSKSEITTKTMKAEVGEVISIDEKQNQYTSLLNTNYLNKTYGNQSAGISPHNGYEITITSQLLVVFHLNQK